MIETTVQTREAPARTGVPRLGFAGVGWIGRHRLAAIARERVAEISAIYDPASSSVEQAAKLAPEAVKVRRFDDLLKEDLDGIVIATPNAYHAEQSIAALEAGKAVFCQKPLARNSAETQRVIAAAFAADRLLGVDLSYRHTTGMRLIRELIRGDSLGDIYAIEAVFHNAYGPDKPWFYDPRLSGGGCLLDLGIHLVDLGLWCLGYPEVRGAAGQLLSGGRPWNPSRGGIEDYASAQLTLANGTAFHLATSWKAPCGTDARIELTFFGTKGGASFRNVNGSFYDFTAERLRLDRTRELLTADPEEWGGRAAAAWARRLALSPAFDPDVAWIQTAARVIDEIYGGRP
jgi:predicted dehydrogenase